MNQQHRSLTIRRQDALLPSILTQTSIIVGGFKASAKVLEVELKDIRPIITQALLDELIERLNEGRI